MRNKLIRRTLLMATLVVAVVAGSSLPASAVTTHLDVTDSNGSAAGGANGTLTMNGTTIDFPGPGTGPCALPGTSSYLDLDVDASGNITLPATGYRHDISWVPQNGLAPTTFPISGTDYRFQIFGHHNTAGSIWGSSFSLSLDMQFVFSPCLGGSTLCTVNHVVLTLYGSYSGSVPPVSGDLANNLYGTSPALASSNFAIGCDSTIRAALLGDAVTVTLHLQKA